MINNNNTTLVMVNQ